MSDEDSDASVASDYGLLKKALPFDCTIPSNFDPNRAPQTAEEFLQYAAYERSLVKPWISAEIDPSKLTRSVTYKLKIEKIDNFVSPDFLPSQEWQKKKIDEFIEFRDFIQPKIKSSPKNVLQEQSFEDQFVQKSPKYSEVITYTQADKIRILELIINYLDSLDVGTSIGLNVGSWIYAMLSLLELPLHSDDCHTVRQLAKKCIILRSNYKETVKKKYYPFNLFICIVSKFYRQLDLSDP